ncbi:hypothetical protein PHMEG_00016110 [Phytophthora megakarya]|uniref:Ubiquitin-like protease family profile domain-containing protein n=1 Tax=Phytophthora megakarya TaxID=4795 RepID=A0A225VZS6_9STRA|nr:hypothetical protein PHMEG_00016110 [Phytophthora megakarya]
MRLRGLLRDKDVCDIVVCLEEIMPNLAEVRSYLHAHEVRFHSKSCSFTWSVDPSFVADIIRFRLREVKVDEMLEHLKNTKKTLNDRKPVREEIAIDGEDNIHADIVVVLLDKVGTFEREQIEAMKWLWNLQKICDGGIRCCTWLLNEVQQQVECTEAVTLVENILKAKWPYADVPGLSAAKYGDLYRFRSRTWLSNASIQAFTCYLQERFKNNSCVVVASVSESAAMDQATFSVETFVKIGEAIETNDYVFIPVNFDQTHNWVCIVVARVTKQIIV